MPFETIKEKTIRKWTIRGMFVAVILLVALGSFCVLALHECALSTPVYWI